MDVAWSFGFCMFSRFSEFYDFFEVDGTFMGKFMAKFLQSLAGLWQNCSKAVAELWQGSGNLAWQSLRQGDGKAMAECRRHLFPR